MEEVAERSLDAGLVEDEVAESRFVRQLRKRHFSRTERRGDGLSLVAVAK
jgi:hypothetical protein